MSDNPLEFDIDTMPWSELIDVETAADAPASKILSSWFDGTWSAAQLSAFAWVIARRTEPGLTLDEFRGRSFAGTLQQIRVAGGEENPTGGAA